MKSSKTTVMEQPVEQIQPAQESTPNQGLLTLPMGLLGFEQHKRYALLASPEEAPFLWLQMAGDPNLSFLVVSPSAVVDSYQPDLCDEDVAFLGLEQAQDALIFSIVTVHPDGQATVNLKGPIVVNRRTLVGKQVIPRNAANYSLQFPLEREAVAA
jgi:flagellar assembly factor FliW